MKTCRNRILAAAFVLGLTMSLSACEKPGRDQVELTVIHGWGSTEDDHAAMRDIYESFQEENPDIRLHLMSMPTTDEVLRKVEDMMMVGKLPDVVFLGGEGRDSVYRYMVENNLALDLMPYVKEDEAFRENLAPANLAYWQTEEGSLYTVSDVLLLSGGYWYNKDIFQNAGVGGPPKTWEEFYEACAKISTWAKQADNGVQTLKVRAEGYLYLADYLMYQDGGMPREAVKNHQIVIREQEAVRLLEQLGAVYAYSQVDSQRYSYRDETSLFNEGKLAMFINGVWGAPMIEKGINAGYALFPSDKGKSVACESACLGYVVGNHREEARREAGVRFLKYMMSDAVQERILLETEQVPANPSVSPENYAQVSGRFADAVGVVRSSDIKIETPDNLWENTKMEVFENHILEVLSGEMNRQTFIDLLK